MNLTQYSAALFVITLLTKLTEKRSESNLTEISPKEIVKIFKQ